jgi:hypothetical protein
MIGLEGSQRAVGKGARIQEGPSSTRSGMATDEARDRTPYLVQRVLKLPTS